MQNQVALPLKSNYALFSPSPNTIPNPRFFPSLAKRNFYFYSVLKCRGIEIPLPKQRLNSLSLGNGSVEDERVKTVGVKDIDVATIGNLCVDVVLNVPKLPPKPLDEREVYMEELSKSPPDKVLLCYNNKLLLFRAWNLSLLESRFGEFYLFLL